MALFLNAAPGRVYCPPGAYLTAAVVANTMYAIPFSTPPRGLRIDQIGIRVTTAGASTNARLGIYRDLDGSPGNLIIDGGATGLLTPAGAFPLDLTPSGDGRTYLELAPQRAYWLVSLFNGTATLAGIGATAVSQAIHAAMGSPSFATIPSSASTGYTGLTAPQTYANGLPADGRSVTWTQVAAVVPNVGLRAAPNV